MNDHKVWCVRERTGTWHALAPAFQEDRPEDDAAWFDEILCGDGITLPGRRVFRSPDCKGCLSNIGLVAS